MEAMSRTVRRATGVVRASSMTASIKSSEPDSREMRVDDFSPGMGHVYQVAGGLVK